MPIELKFLTYRLAGLQVSPAPAYRKLTPLCSSNMTEPVVLDGFVLAVPPDRLSLYVTSYLFLADTFEPELDLTDVYENVKSGQLWILPSTVNLQIVVCIEGATLVDYESCDNVLEFLAEKICRSPVS